MNADDPKFTAHALGEDEDLTPAERAGIEAFMASNPAAAAEAAETKELAARLRAELPGEAAPALDEKQRATVLHAAQESGAKTKIVPLPRRTKWFAAIAACFTLAVLVGAFFPPFSKVPKTRKSREAVSQLAALPPGPAGETRSAVKSPAPSAPVASEPAPSDPVAAPEPAATPAETKTERSAGETLALNEANPAPGAVTAASVSPPAAGGHVEGAQSPAVPQTDKNAAEERESLERLAKLAHLEKKTATLLQSSASRLQLGVEPALPAKDANSKPLTEKDLLKRIATIDSGLASAAASGSAAPAAPALPPSKALESAALDLARSMVEPSKDMLGKAAPAGSAGLGEIAPEAANGTMIGSGVASDSDAEKAKQPTVIDALDSKFDQEANQAVFVGEVVVKDPEFNVWCDKLTAFTKHEEKNGKGGKTPAKAATPKPANGKSEPPRGGGLDHAIAVVTEEGHRVKIIQDKIDPDTGKLKHGVGFCNWAYYDGNTGDIIMHGSPDVTQNSDRCVATAPNTVITLNRDGHMIAKGPHRTFVIDDSTPKTDDVTHLATPQPGSIPNPVTPGQQ
ncbi:MAG TPA: hypothetical protein VGM54_07525 [Chthoniobacter sp.]|jgi:hypothetical protein